MTTRAREFLLLVLAVLAAVVAISVTFDVATWLMLRGAR